MLKLTSKNVENHNLKFHSINLEGNYYRSVTSSEGSELKKMYNLATRLHELCRCSNITEKQYIRLASRIDRFPLTSIFFRELIISDLY